MQKFLRLCALALCGMGFWLACSPSPNQEATLAPQASPSLSDEARLSTAVASNAQASPSPLPPSVSPSPQTFDPGPYFTPNRPGPEGPAAAFSPPEQVADFRRFQLWGQCEGAAGQTAYYTRAAIQSTPALDPQNPAPSPDPLSLATLSLTCRYLEYAAQGQTAIEMLLAELSGPPLFMALQGEKSFLLGQSGTGYLYAWTQGRWLFLARSPQGRAPLDDFMQAFPH